MSTAAEQHGAGTGDLSPEITFPLKSRRILRNERTGEPSRRQGFVETEMIGSNDVKMIMKVHLKKTDLGDRYKAVTFTVVDLYWKSTDLEPAKSTIGTITMDDVKGQMFMDYKMDTITTVYTTRNQLDRP
jgi:hypothetical protein